MIAARSSPLAATLVIPSAVSLKSSATKCASASSRAAARTGNGVSTTASKHSKRTRRSFRKRIAEDPGGNWGGGGCRLPMLESLQQATRRRHAPHLLVLVFQLPHFLPTQSPIRSLE